MKTDNPLFSITDLFISFYLVPFFLSFFFYYFITSFTMSDTEPVVADVQSSTASSVKSFLSGGFGGMAAVLVG